MTFHVYPAVDIAGGRCVRRLEGRFGNQTVSSDHPIEVASSFAAAGAAWIHVVDLDAVRTGEPRNRDLLVEVCADAPCAVQASGGLRSGADVEEVVAAGAARAVLSPASLGDADGLRSACAGFGGRVAVSLAARGAPGDGGSWSVPGLSVIDAVRLSEAAGAAGFVYTNLDRDGTLSGPDLDGLGAVIAVTSRPVIAAGGIASAGDLQDVASRGVAGAIVGRALYDGTLELARALEIEAALSPGRRPTGRP